MEKKSTQIELLYSKLLQEKEAVDKEVVELRLGLTRANELLAYTQRMLTAEHRRSHERDVMIESVKSILNKF